MIHGDTSTHIGSGLAVRSHGRNRYPEHNSRDALRERPGSARQHSEGQPSPIIAGSANIYETRLDPALGWLEPHVLPCDGPDSINSAWDEFSPSLVEAEGRTILFFSSGRDGVQKIYMSERQPDGHWGPATPVEELNSPAQDARPNVSDDGLEIVFDSTRQGGNPDIWTARRTSISKPWSTPVRLGQNVNSDATETRASLSRDGRRLYFGSNRNGTSDIYVSMRSLPDGK